MRACEIRSTHGDDSALLECAEGGQGGGQLLWESRHSAGRPLAYCVARILAYCARCLPKCNDIGVKHQTHAAASANVRKRAKQAVVLIGSSV